MGKTPPPPRYPSLGTLTSLLSLFTLLLTTTTTNAQQISCSNFGTPSPSNSSTCLCPPGFGNDTCTLPGCGGTYFQGSQRPLAQLLPDQRFANLTASQCSCEDGWSGTGCNVCRNSDACQSAFRSVGGASGGGGGNGLLNETLVCSDTPRVWAAGQMSCQVINPTLQAIFPGSTTLNILRTLQPSRTPIANTTAFGSAGSAYAQLWYDGVEQFYCTADNCVQNVGGGTGGGASSTVWDCQNLQCHCNAGVTWCGATQPDLSNTLNNLQGTLSINCAEPDTSGIAQCSFIQDVLRQLFGANGLSLSGCTFGECVAQNVIDDAQAQGGGGGDGSEGGGGSSLSGGVIAGLAVVGTLIGLAIAVLVFGLWRRRVARREGLAKAIGASPTGGVGVGWKDVSYVVEGTGVGVGAGMFGATTSKRRRTAKSKSKVVLDHVSGHVAPGQMMAILGPSGAGKTTLLEILAGKEKEGRMNGKVMMSRRSVESESSDSTLNDSTQPAPRIAFVPQQDVLPPLLTVHEALLFAARLRLPEYIPHASLLHRVDTLIAQLGLERVRDQRIGSTSGAGAGGEGGKRGLSGGEMRRVSIGLELVGMPDVVLLDEPTSGLDAVSAANVAKVLRGVADGEASASLALASVSGDEGGGGMKKNKTAVIATIHQPSSGLYRLFDQVAVLGGGRTMYVGKGGMTPVHVLKQRGVGGSTAAAEWTEGYNVADWLLEVASEEQWKGSGGDGDGEGNVLLGGGLEKTSTSRSGSGSDQEKHVVAETEADPVNSPSPSTSPALNQQNQNQDVNAKSSNGSSWRSVVASRAGPVYATTFLTQFETLAGREWKILRRDKTLFVTHVAVSSVLGVFCGGLYFNTGTSIAGFQSRVGCLFFLGALIAFSSLSALYNVVESRSLFVRERSNAYYRPSAWLLSRLIFDMIPLRIIPTIIVSSVTYWMAGLSPDPANFFKFLFILVLYSMAMTLFNFLLGCFFHNGGVAILLSALTALYQMTFAGFFVHLADIPPVLRWLQWFCPLKYCLEALSVNEVDSGLMIQDTLQGVPVEVSASLIMQLLFGFGLNNYYRDVLVLFAFIAGFGVGVIVVVWVKVRERR